MLTPGTRSWSISPGLLRRSQAFHWCHHLIPWHHFYLHNRVIAFALLTLHDSIRTFKIRLIEPFPSLTDSRVLRDYLHYFMPHEASMLDCVIRIVTDDHTTASRLP